MVTLVALHGLGATSAVWTPVLDRLDWEGDVLALDLPGHGMSPWTGDYRIEAMASAVADAVRGHLETTGSGDGSVVIVGHSLGGGVGLALASGTHGVDVEAMLGLGIKITWTAEEVAGMAKVAAKGIRWFATRDEAIERFTRTAGLSSPAGLDPELLVGSVVEEANGWRLAQDPASFAQTALDAVGLVSAARCPVVLGAGVDDAMVARTHLETLVDEPAMAPEAGHNVQVDNPTWVADQITRVLDGR